MWDISCSYKPILWYFNVFASKDYLHDVYKQLLNRSTTNHHANKSSTIKRNWHFNLELLNLRLNFFKGPLPRLSQFQVIESPLKMKNNFYFTFKALIVLKKFKLLCWLLCPCRQRVQLTHFRPIFHLRINQVVGFY